MGTNYYWYPKGGGQCPTCGQEMPRRHIGKSSEGWNFGLRIYEKQPWADEPVILSLDDWRELWATGGEIRNEYGDTVTVEQMELIITERSHPGGLWSQVGKAELWARYGGPTYDLIPREFS